MDIESTPFDLQNLLEDVTDVARLQAREKGVEVLLSTKGLKDRRFVSDPVRIRQIVNNLLSNALKFTEHGVVEVNCEATVKDSEAVVTLKVVDSGVGIAPEATARLFENFTQADTSTTRKFGGTGLGLAIVRRLSQLLGGDIAVSSELGVGSAFTVTMTLPLDENNADERTDVAWIDRWQAPAGTRVLVVDDVEINREILIDLLQERGIEVDAAENGVQALNLMEELALPESYQLVLMDCRMPEMDGYEASQQIREGAGGEKHREVPIIACTANVYEDDKDKAISSGMVDIVTKPVDEDELIRSLNHWLH